MRNNIVVECADVLDFSCDVLVLKHAQEFYGADLVVAGALGYLPDRLSFISPDPGQFVLLQSDGRIVAENILYVGVSNLSKFDYEKIRKFTRLSMSIIQQELSSKAKEKR